MQIYNRTLNLHDITAVFLKCFGIKLYTVYQSDIFKIIFGISFKYLTA